MTDPAELTSTLLLIARALDGLGVAWAIGGSVASGAHGEPRATNDVDIIAVLDEDAARALGGLLGPEFYADSEVAVEAVRNRASFNVIDKRTFLKIDVFIPGPGPLGVGQVTRARRLSVFPGAPPLPVLTPEDIVLQKLRWYLAGGEVSDRQWRDLVSVLRHNQADLEIAYLRDVASGRMAELLERAILHAAAP